MPAGIPVATMAIGKAGATNAAILAIEILALSDEGLREKLQEHKRKLAEGVEQKSSALRERLGKAQA
jgi:5-(carboxyamino)imidazole ribonucleotide mutase